MTPQEWNNLQVGDQVIYTAPRFGYANTICKVTSITPNVTLTIIRSGNLGYSTWGNGRITVNSWDPSDYYKFTLYKEAAPLETRITAKIKTLDQTWAQTQAKKGNKYAMEIFK